MPCIEFGNAIVCYNNAYEIDVDGKIWGFEFHRYCGPLWLRKDGHDRKCQCPTLKRVWEEFQKWLDKSEYKYGKGGLCDG